MNSNKNQAKNPLKLLKLESDQIKVEKQNKKIKTNKYII